MLASDAPTDRREALAGLRSALLVRHRDASEAAFIRGEDLVATGFPALDEVLAGGFPRGIIATLEGPPSSGRSTLAARLLAAATARGLGALVQTPEMGTLYPPALEAAGVVLDRLLVVSSAETIGVARAADILLRSAAFGVVAIPAVSLKATAWTRLAGLAHRANALLVAVGIEASSELRYFASLRVRLQLDCVRWSGSTGPFSTLAGYDVRADVIKAKRSAPGRGASVTCATFEVRGPAPASVRERAIDHESARIHAASGRY